MTEIAGNDWKAVAQIGVVTRQRHEVETVQERSDEARDAQALLADMAQVNRRRKWSRQSQVGGSSPKVSNDQSVARLFAKRLTSTLATAMTCFKAD